MTIVRSLPNDASRNGSIVMTSLGLQFDAIARPRVQRPSSTIEGWGRWIGLIVALTSMFTVLRVGIGLFNWPPDPDAWEFAATYWRMQFIGVGIVTMVLAVVPHWLSERRLLRWPVLAIAALSAAAVGWTLQDFWIRLTTGVPIPAVWMTVHRHTLLVLASLLAILFELRRMDRDAEAAVHQAALNRVRLQSELASSRLQVLQAQIEPHFIFNSLANVRRLLRIDGVAGRAMLADFLRYLESALPRLRDDTPTLGREVELARAYLAVHQVRMGPRLKVEFDIRRDLVDRPIPSMMLLTLVENALKHGLAPLVEGGTIRIEAFADAHGRLNLSVADTGRGLSAGIGHGMGLANIRARLQAMHGDRAGLRFMVNEPQGVIATLALPAASR